MSLQASARTRMRRRMRISLISAWVILIATVSIVAAPIAASAQPAPQSTEAMSGAPAVPSTVTEGAKDILSDTSVAGPGLIANTPEGVGAAIAWAGTDPLHHINVMTSSDGLHYGSKRILNEYTVDRPAIAREAARGGGAIAIAWRGTDSLHRVNVLYDPYGVHGGSSHLLVTSQTTTSTPAIAFFQAKLLLAWTGTDPAHHLNVLPIGIEGPSLTPGTKTILGFTASTGPSLGLVTNRETGEQAAVLSWATPDSRINLAQSSDGVKFTSALGDGLLATTGSSPAFVHFSPSNGPEYWIGWTGTDASHHLNAKWTSTSAYPQWTGAKTILPELALGEPGLGFQDGVLIAWTGTDPLHHLNIARLQGS